MNEKSFWKGKILTSRYRTILKVMPPLFFDLASKRAATFGKPLLSDG